MAAQALGRPALIVLADVPRAQAALQCEYYDQLVAEAAMVMQIAPSLIEAPAAQSEFCRVQGEVIRAFKGPHPVGTMIETSIPCQNGWVDASGETVFMVGPNGLHRPCRDGSRRRHRVAHRPPRRPGRLWRRGRIAGRANRLARVAQPMP